MEHILSKGPLLDDKGNLIEAGYAFSLIKDYQRSMIKGLKTRIKEWDYYYIGNKDYGVAFTVADNSYMWQVSASFLDFKNNINITKSPIGFFSFGKLNIPSSSKNGDLIFKKRGITFEFKNDNGKRNLFIHFDKFTKNNESFDCNVSLKETNESSMVISTPFKKKKHFYYNQKINLLEAKGSFKIGEKQYSLDNCYGVLDWGRGIWTYKNTWYWSSINTIYNNQRIGWNLGYGFGDTSNASENMFFYNDKAYKLENVIFNIPKNNKDKDDFISPWKITSLSGDINVYFKPVMDRHSDTNVLLIRSNQHQVFGLFTGTVKLKDKEVYFEDVPGFAEKVYNRW